MFIQKAQWDDLADCLRIYEAARWFMIQQGNPDQWGKSYPEKAIVEEDIRQQQLYVLRDEEGIHGCFVFFIHPDPTYAIIEGGQWLNDEPYGVIHRLASDGTRKRISDTVFNFCIQQIGNLRIDTHPCNYPMQSALKRYGFTRTGTILTHDHTRRWAYQYIRKD